MKADGVMGCAVFWNRKTLALSESEQSSNSSIVAANYDGQNQNYIIAHFIHLQSSIRFMLATTHLKAKSAFMAVREAEAK